MNKTLLSKNFYFQLPCYNVPHRYREKEVIFVYEIVCDKLREYIIIYCGEIESQFIELLAAKSTNVISMLPKTTQQ